MPVKLILDEYRVWQSMKQRCGNPRHKQWKDYGGRGIDVCDRWKASFSNFLDDMGPRPPGLTIERIDNSMGYYPENCKWASRSEQMRNRRNTVILTIDGERHLLIDLVSISGHSDSTIKARVKRGLSYDEVIDPTKKTLAEWSAVGRQKQIDAARMVTHCKEGHELTGKNRIPHKRGWNICRICYNARKLREAKSRKS